MSNWQPIETAPRDGRVVLCWGHGTVVQVEPMVFYPSDDDPNKGIWGWLEGDSPRRPPTHWMTIPDPPK